MTVEEQLAAALAEVESLRTAIAEKDCEEAEKTITKTITVKARPSRRPLDTTGLPEKVFHIYPDGVLDGDGNLKAEYVEIGTDESSRLEKRPAEVYIHKDVFHKVILKSDIGTKHPEDREILSPERPPAPVARCMAGASVLSDIIVGKFVYHLPFYRQIQQYRECGITISDSTMGGWYEAAVEKLKLLYDILRRQILSSEYVQVDESVIPVIDNEKHKARKGYEWCVRDGITGDVMFWYDRGSRGHHVAREILGGYRGNVQCDGYEAYDQFERMPGITVHGCWAHVRRKFVDSLKENERLAMEGILFIRKLYKVESDADDKGLSAEERMEQRRKISYPTILMFEKWIEETYARVLPSPAQEQARRGPCLCLQSSSPSVALRERRQDQHRQQPHRECHQAACSRQEELSLLRQRRLRISGSHRILPHRHLQGCRAAGVDPRTWMEDVLSKLPYWQRDGKDLAGLLPRAWAKENQITPK